MSRKDRWMFISTFLMGMVTGAYLYFIGFLPTYMNVTSNFEGMNRGTVSIQGEMYGGCEQTDSCAAFKVNQNGSFRYIPRSNLPDSQIIEGTLPEGLMDELLKDIQRTKLAERAELVDPNFCASRIGANDYRYQITIENIPYALDTCSSNFSHRTPLGETLNVLWNYFETRT